MKRAAPIAASRPRRALGRLLRALGRPRAESGPWSVARWDRAYESGQLDYFGALPEQARYSVIAGLLEALEVRGRVLDAGCGQGILARRCAHLPFSGWTGVDLSERAIEQARRAVRDPRCRFLVEDLLAAEARWMAEPHEVAVLNEVLYMCDDPERLLGRVLESLSGEGWLILSNWRHRGERALWRTVERRARIVESVLVRSSSNPIGPRGWRVALCRPRVHR